MLLTAERVMIDGVARADVGVRLDADGRIGEVGAIDGMGTPDERLDGRLLLLISKINRRNKNSFWKKQKIMNRNRSVKKALLLSIQLQLLL